MATFVLNARRGLRASSGPPEVAIFDCGVLHLSLPNAVVRGMYSQEIGNAMVRASCILQLALGNIGKSGGGANIFRGHDNVQGATDVGPNPDSLPGYYGLAAGYGNTSQLFGVLTTSGQGRYAPDMEKSGTTVSRWVDAVLEKNDMIDQQTNVKGLFFWGHAPTTNSRLRYEARNG